MITRESSTLFGRRKAVFSDCERYRYWLEIRVAKGPLCNFLMLNPSTADENRDDPTVAKCRRFAKRWGYGGIVVTNLFALRATDPREMLAAAEPIGLENDRYISDAARYCDMVICAWSQYGNHLGRADHVYRMILECRNCTPSALKVAAEPWHPLYLRENLLPIEYVRGMS